MAEAEFILVQPDYYHHCYTHRYPIGAFHGYGTIDQHIDTKLKDPLKQVTEAAGDIKVLSSKVGELTEILTGC